MVNKLLTRTREVILWADSRACHNMHASRYSNHFSPTNHHSVAFWYHIKIFHSVHSTHLSFDKTIDLPYFRNPVLQTNWSSSWTPSWKGGGRIGLLGVTKSLRWWGGVKLVTRTREHCAWCKQPKQLIFFVNKKWLLIELSYFTKQILDISYGMMESNMSIIKIKYIHSQIKQNL